MKRLLTGILLCALLAGCPPTVTPTVTAQTTLSPVELAKANERLKAREKAYFEAEANHTLVINEEGVAFAPNWEKIEVPHAWSDVYRTKVPGGWLIISEVTNKGTSLLFLADPAYLWCLDLDEAKVEKD